MAVLPLNTFRTITRDLLPQGIPTPVRIYTCPIGVTAIILLAQISNVGTDTGQVTFNHLRLTTSTSLVKEALIPTNDALSVLSGRLVLEESDSIEIIGDPSQRLQVVISLVESANT